MWCRLRVMGLVCAVLIGTVAGVPSGAGAQVDPPAWAGWVTRTYHEVCVSGCPGFTSWTKDRQTVYETNGGGTGTFSVDASWEELKSEDYLRIDACGGAGGSSTLTHDVDGSGLGAAGATLSVIPTTGLFRVAVSAPSVSYDYTELRTVQDCAGDITIDTTTYQQQPSDAAVNVPGPASAQAIAGAFDVSATVTMELALRRTDCDPLIDSDGDGTGDCEEHDSGTNPLVPDLPVLTPGGAWGPEGDSGSTVVQVPITLSAPASEEVTVAWETFPYAGEALATSGVDYAPGSGTVTIPAGELTGYAPVTIYGDTLDEYAILGGEFLFVRFSNPSPNATLDRSFFGLGAYVIQDVDTPPAIVPGTSTITEGDAGTGAVSIPINLTAPSGKTITVDWQTTALGTATPDDDFVIDNGVLTFNPGDTATTIDLTIVGDTDPEADETVIAKITNPNNATIGGYYGLGIATITNDD